MEITTHPRKYLRKRVPVSRPEITSYFSVGSQGDYKDDISEIKYFKMPPSSRVNFDLNRNMENVIKKQETDVKLRSILLNFKEHRKTLLFNEQKIFLRDVPFVLSRGLLRDMSALPYKDVDLRFSACLFRGVLYLHFQDTPDTTAKRANVTDKEIAMTIWGHKFEKYMLSVNPKDEPDIESPADEVSGFFGILECDIGRHHLIYRAEMDGIQVDETLLKEEFHPEKHSRKHVLEQLKKFQFVELKTNRHIKKKYHNITFRKYKCLSWWLQSFFGGVDTIVCGFRNEAGVVEEIKNYETHQLPEQCCAWWNPDVCLNFCSELLSFIKGCFAQKIQCMLGNVGNVRDLPNIELVFERLSGSNVRLIKPLPNENISILEDWFINIFPPIFNPEEY